MKAGNQTKYAGAKNSQETETTQTAKEICKNKTLINIINMLRKIRKAIKTVKQGQNAILKRNIKNKREHFEI